MLHSPLPSLITLALFCMGCGGVKPYVPTAAPADTLRFPTAPPDALRRIEGDTLLIKGARLIDGLGGPAVPDRDVLIQDGKIAQIGENIEAADLPVLDARGLTLMPGLITSHVHLQTPPGTVIRQDDAATIRALQLLQLRAYLACGFTSVLDTAISGPTIQWIRGHLDKGGVGPNFFFLAPFLTPAKGYLGSPDLRGAVFRDLWPPIELPGDIPAQLAAAKPLGPKGVKVTVEEGIEFSIWPIFDDARLDQIGVESAKIGTPVYVHSRTDAAHLAALRTKPHALVHAGYIKGTPAPEVIAGIKAQGTYVISTTAISTIATWGLDQTFAGDEWLRLRVPILQWQTATDPDSPDALTDILVATNTPGWLPNWLARLFFPLIAPGTEGALEYTRSSAKAVKTFYDAGIPIVLGADEGNWPAFTTFFHGVSSQIELEALDRAGLPRGELIVASTSRPAEMLGESARIGSVEVGKDADLVLVGQDPLMHGMDAIRDIRWTIKRGHARSPAAWLEETGGRESGGLTAP